MKQTLIFILAALMLTCCGKKPTHLDPPPSGGDPAYPRDYPKK